MTTAREITVEMLAVLDERVPLTEKRKSRLQTVLILEVENALSESRAMARKSLREQEVSVTKM